MKNEEWVERGGDRRRRHVWVALAVGAVVFSIAYLAAWLQFRNSPYVAHKRMVTLGAFGGMQRAIEDFVKDARRLPSSMTELLAAEGSALRRNDRGEVCDGWRNPIDYVLERDSYRLRSLGRDGRPGGVGIDADMGTELGQGFSKDWDATRPTLRQFAFELPGTRGILWGCVLSALLATAIYGIGARPRPDHVVTSREKSVNVVGTILFSLFIGAILVFFLAPWGH
jgi:4-amino-4-deoxy-L-arabinose transferase-like glycosyltransferase